MVTVKMTMGSWFKPASERAGIGEIGIGSQVNGKYGMDGFTTVSPVRLSPVPPPVL